MNADEKKKENLTLFGTSISSGLAVGRAFVYRDILQRDHERYEIQSDEIDQEYGRIEQAIEEVRQDLELASERVGKDLNEELAAIFRAQEAMLCDPTLADDFRKELEQELVNAEQVVKTVFRRWERKFCEMPDETLSQRGDDVADVSRRVLRKLAGLQAHALEEMDAGSVLVARRLLSSDTVFLSRHSAVATVVELGGRGSHAALLTREMGIPAVGQVADVLDRIGTGDLLLVDGLSGRVVVEPDAEMRATFERWIEGYQAHVAQARRRCGEPARTGDGTSIEVMANVSRREDVEQAVENGADGVGLYRLEGFYMAGKMLPSEDELMEHLVHTLEPVKERPITIRLLDIGGDKVPPYLHLPDDPEPFLGLRGIRILLKYPDLLDTQLKVLLEISREMDIRILVPMVTLLGEMKKVRDRLRDAAADMGIGKQPALGAMVETPAAALCVEELAEVADFFSIGTNDLTQYTMAASRENPLVDGYFVEDHPAVLKMVRFTVKNSDARPVSLCGELAGKQDAIGAVLDTGIRTLSVAPPLVPIVKEIIRKIRLHRKD